MIKLAGKNCIRADAQDILLHYLRFVSAGFGGLPS